MVGRVHGVLLPYAQRSRPLTRREKFCMNGDSPNHVVGQGGDLKTADHKVLNEELESRNSHRYAVIVQDFANQGSQAYPCKTNISQETKKSLPKFLRV